VVLINHLLSVRIISAVPSPVNPGRNFSLSRCFSSQHTKKSAAGTEKKFLRRFLIF